MSNKTTLQIAKEKFAKFKEFFNQLAEIAPPPAPPIPVPPVATASAFPLNNGTTAYVNCADDGIIAIDAADAIFSDPAMTIPLIDGTYTTADNALTFTVVGGIVTIATPAVAPAPAETEMKTPVQMAAWVNKRLENVKEKFSSTNPDMDNVIIILKAMFENQFGWELRQAQEAATRAAAIEVYKEAFTKQNKTVVQMMEAFKEIMPVLEAFSDIEIGKPTEEVVDEIMTLEKFNSLSPLEQFRYNKSQFSGE